MGGYPGEPWGVGQALNTNPICGQAPHEYTYNGIFIWRVTFRSTWHAEQKTYTHDEQRILYWNLATSWNLDYQTFESIPLTPCPSHNAVVAWGPEALSGREDRGRGQQRAQSLATNPPSIWQAIRNTAHGTIQKLWCFRWALLLLHKLLY